MPVSNAWPERGESAKEPIKTSKKNILKNDTLNALLMISRVNGQFFYYNNFQYFKLRN